ncbi:MAG: glycosyltransferase family 39 protein [Patescibacteria group bacterium]|nr:glycosyltransferase family 39 protein [Patescibacteria group bacterium]
MEHKFLKFTNQTNKTHWSIYLLLIFVIIIAIFLRFYKLDQIPPSLDWDEVAAGYNAYTIANWGQDEWGNKFPLTFHSFGDDKSPIHIYVTAIFVKLFGLSDLVTRSSSAFFGTLNVIIIFFLANVLFGNKSIGLFAALFLAISPYNLQFSRFNHEANYALFFMMLGLYLVLLSLHKKPYLLPLAVISFGLSMLSYHSGKVVVPGMILLLVVLFWKKLIQVQKYALISLAIFVGIVMLYLTNRQLLGGARLQQLQIPSDKVLTSQLYLQTHNQLLGKVNVIFDHYLTHFSWEYLFVSGDANPRHSIQTVGEFYQVDIVLIVLGLLAMLFFRTRGSVLVLAWLLLAPLPAAVVGSASGGPHAGRALFMMGSWQIIAAFGLSSLIKLFKKPLVQGLVLCVVLVVLGWQFKLYIYDYYHSYAKKYAIEWQYGMKQIVSFVKANPQYDTVYMTDVRSQPYIFFLYYLKTPLPEFRNSVIYNQSHSAPSNLVTSFGKYHFGDWDPIESKPISGVLYIVGPSNYDGLRYKSQFDVKRLVRFPNKDEAFYIVSAL